MNHRQNRGQTISLVACVAFVLVALGTLAFFLTRLIGGARELTNASDAGILNAAKQSLITPNILPNDNHLPAAAQDFFALSDPPGVQGAVNGAAITYKPLDLLTYNRLVAQSMLIAANAEAEGNMTAISNAHAEIDAAKSVGAYLQKQIDQNGPLNSAYLQVADANHLRMLDGQVKLNVNLKGAYLNHGGSTNIWFDPSILSSAPTNGTAQLKPEQAVVKQLYNGALPANYSSTNFVAGYEPISLLNGSATLYAVPLMPEQHSHLVDLTRFNAGLPVPDGSVPQNALRAQSRAYNKGTNSYVNTVSCAITGSLSKYYIGQIPAGYIRVVNAPFNSNGPVAGDLNQVLGQAQNVLYDGSNDLFNTALVFGSSYIYVAKPYSGNADTTSFALGANGLAAMKIWSTYNDSHGDDGLGHNGDLDPLKGSYPGGTPFQLKKHPDMPSKSINIGSGSNQKALLKDLVGIKGYVQISDESFNGSEDAMLDAMVPVMSSNLGCGDVLVDIGADHGFTAVEWLKARIIQGRAKSDVKAFLEIPKQHSGMKVFDHYKKGTGILIHYASPPFHAQFENVGTPLGMINQINSVLEPSHSVNSTQAAYLNFINSIAQRTREINPNFDASAVANALNSAPLDLGQTLYLHADPSGTKLVMDTNVHYDSGLKPDGANALQNYSSGPYDIGLCLVDTQKDGSSTAPRGDMNFHNVPWKAMSDTGYLNEPPTTGGSNAALNSAATSVLSTETAAFVPSSGFGNLLGELHFDNGLQGKNGGALFMDIPN